MLLKKMALPVVAGILFYSCAALQKTGKEKSVSTTVVSTDTTKKGVSKVKPYKEIITAKAITDSGLFKVHKIEDKYFFEIRDSLLNRDILVVNRIAKGALQRFPDRKFGYAGDLIGENVIQFSKGPNNKVFIKQISYTYAPQSKDSTENGMYRSVLNSNLQPIVASFDIKALSPDSNGVVLDITDFINGDNDIFFFSTQAKKSAMAGAIQADKSYVDGVQSFPQNVEIRTVKTYATTSQNPTDAATNTYMLNSSLLLLPALPMQPRYFDKRVGYFATDYIDFDADPQGVENTSMITRWRLEPKDEDKDRYKRGELVEPKKPIVFYIDPTTPKKWVPYLIQGINNWQKAFEKAGFKNAIYALEAPINDPEWSLEDARHNAIVYKPSDIANASGPHVHDPRTGEILESHVNWYHNIMSLLHNWYFVQAGAIDPRARKMEFDDSLMGQLIRFVSSHEIGHTLGLRHNFGASSTVAVDSLRSKKWVEANGICPSIMDYARFNYVAQPEDSVSEIGIFPRIGAYDEWAIEWGYKWFPDLKTEKEEKAYLNRWIIDRTAKDKRLWFGSEIAASDPSCQSEDLGDNAMKASRYGIKNLKRIVPQLPEWIYEPGKDYEPLKRMYDVVFNQYKLYVFHVAKNIAGRHYRPKTMDQSGEVFQFIISRETQKEAVQFLQQELFTTPLWLTNKKIYTSTGAANPAYINSIQRSMLAELISRDKLENFQWPLYYSPEEAYTINEYLADLKKGIWSELKDHKPIDVYRRALQRVYLFRLITVSSPLKPDEKPEVPGDYFFTPHSDVPFVIKNQMRELMMEINTVLPFYKDKDSKIHLIGIRDRLKEVLEPKSK